MKRKRGRPMHGARPKKPSDYDQISFRVPEGDYKRLTALIEEVHEYMNANRTEGLPRWGKGDVLVRSLFLGLKQLKREKS